MRPNAIAVTILLAAGLLGCSRAGNSARPEESPVDRSRVWSVEQGTGGADRLVRGPRVDAIKDDLEKIIKALNQLTALEWGRGVGADGPGTPVLWLRSVRDGIAHVEVADAEFLTQKMGTTGAFRYLAAATYSITEAPGIRAVNFAFAEGDHAAPGVYTRASFRALGVEER